jgi:hypothetical protein
MTLRWMHNIIYLSKPIECTTPRMKSIINYGLGIMTMCQCRFIDCNKCDILSGIVDSTGSAYVEQEVYKKSISSAQFSCGTKTALKNKDCFVKNN